MKTTFKQLALVAMGAVMAQTVSGKETTRWVDLGLPSGVLWAKCNLGGARIPTVDEWRELYKNTTVKLIKQNGVNGLIFTAPNGNSIFLPAAGSRSGTMLNRVGAHGYYWSSSLHPSDMKCAWSYRFDRWDKGMYPDFRYAGYPIRPVRSAS